MKKVVVVRMDNNLVVGERKAEFLWKPMIIQFIPNPHNRGEVRINFVSPFMNLAEPKGSRLVLPKGGYYITEAPRELEQAWRQAVSNIKTPTIEDIKKVSNIKMVNK